MEPAAVIPAVYAASSVACVRSLKRRNVHTITVAEDDGAPALSSRYSDESFVVPSSRDNLTQYANALLELAQRDDVRTIAPMREEDIYVLSRYRPEFGEFIATPWPTFDTLHTVHDRVQLVQVAEAAGVPVPKTELLDDVDDWDRQLIVKPRYGLLTNDYVESIPSRKSLRGGSVQYLKPGVEPDRASICEERWHVPIVQEYVSGTEYAFWALYDRGEPVATCQRNRVRGNQYSGNTSVFRETVRDPELEAAGRALLDRLEWHGPASVQFIKDEATGEFTLMEINPRFWLSLPTAIRAGVDFPYYYWRLANGDRRRYDVDYEVGVATHHLLGEASYLNSVLGKDFSYVEKPRMLDAIREVLVSLVEEPHFDYLHASDPGPFIRDLLSTIDLVTQKESPIPKVEQTNEDDGQSDLPSIEFSMP